MPKERQAKGKSVHQNHKQNENLELIDKAIKKWQKHCTLEGNNYLISVANDKEMNDKQILVYAGSQCTLRFIIKQDNNSNITYDSHNNVTLTIVTFPSSSQKFFAKWVTALNSNSVVKEGSISSESAYKVLRQSAEKAIKQIFSHTTTVPTSSYKVTNEARGSKTHLPNELGSGTVVNLNSSAAPLELLSQRMTDDNPFYTTPQPPLLTNGSKATNTSIAPIGGSQNSNAVWIIGAVGGGLFLLVFVGVVLLVCRCCSSRSSRTNRRDVELSTRNNTSNNVEQTQVQLLKDQTTPLPSPPGLSGVKERLHHLDQVESGYETPIGKPETGYMEPISEPESKEQLSGSKQTHNEEAVYVRMDHRVFLLR